MGVFSFLDKGGRIYVVNHSDIWINRTKLVDVSSDGYETVGYGAGRSFRNKLTWPEPLTPGTYDLILDLNVTGYNGVWTHIPGPVGYITDPIWYFNVTGRAGISIEKTASTNGACPGFDPLSVQLGDNVTYCFNVTNNGSVTLTNIDVNDDHYGPISLGTDTLAPGESTGGTATHTVNESDIPSSIPMTAR